MFLFQALVTLYILISDIPVCIGQSAGDLRLFTFLTNSDSGRLEIFLNDTWGTVCLDGFDMYEADLACRQLGYLYATRARLLGFVSVPETVPVWLEGVSCPSNASRLIDCPRLYSTNCSHTRDVLLTCSNSSDRVVLESRDGLRRFGSTSLGDLTLSAGRLQIFINDTWGTVCGNLFDRSDADVACRQLGFQSSVAFTSATKLNYTVSSPDVPIWLDSLDCPSSPDLADLRACPHAGTGLHSCQHGDDVILSCLTEGSLRLVNTSQPTTTLLSAGRLEVFVGGVWGTVCNNAFNSVSARVACRQLGFTGALAFGTNVGFPFPPAGTPVLLDEVRCGTTNFNLLSCSHSTTHVGNCSHSQDIALICNATFPSPTSGYEGQLRLVSEASLTSPASGRLEIFLNSAWGTVCIEGFHMHEADLACKQLGFLYAKNVGTAEYLGFSPGSGNVWLQDVGCSLLDTRLVNCVRQSFVTCSHRLDVAVTCSNSREKH